MNGWSSLSQEVLISTPRRFGKTISVSTFAAAMMFSCPTMELSIYSTCKRISQKLLRNILKFLDTIYRELRVPPYRVIRQNAEELVVAGPEGVKDTRHVNSYPSKVCPVHLLEHYRESEHYAFRARPPAQALPASSSEHYRESEHYASETRPPGRALPAYSSERFQITLTTSNKDAYTYESNAVLAWSVLVHI